MIEMIAYVLAIRSTIYAMLYTRLYVSYTLSISSRYRSNISEGHWKIVKNIIRYLRKTKNVFLVHREHELVVYGYSDASFQLDIDDNKSQLGYIFTLNGNVVS
jgi:hypothetical protein